MSEININIYDEIHEILHEQETCRICSDY